MSEIRVHPDEPREVLGLIAERPDDADPGTQEPGQDVPPAGQPDQPLPCWEKQLVTGNGETFLCALPTGHEGDCQPFDAEPVCDCDEGRFTVCHDPRNEPHYAGCPRWGMRLKHYNGNLDCPYLLRGCNLCDPDGTFVHGAYSPTGEQIDLLGRIVRMWQTHQTFAEKLFVRAIREGTR